MLQLFIEANCTDYALLLSILLQDAASIGRIINVAIRAESYMICARIESVLKCLMQWSHDRDCQYRSFMNCLEPHIYQLGQFLTSANAQNFCKYDDSEENKNIPFDSTDEIYSKPHNPDHNQRVITGKQNHYQLKRQTSLLETSISRVQKSNIKRTSHEDIRVKEPSACAVM